MAKGEGSDGPLYCGEYAFYLPDYLLEKSNNTQNKNNERENSELAIDLD